MKYFDETLQQEFRSRRILLMSALMASFIETILIVLLGQSSISKFNPIPLKNSAETLFLETQLVETPKENTLIEEKKGTKTSSPTTEETLSKDHGKGKSALEKTLAPSQNITQASPQLAPSHGPIAIFSPTPILPSHLKYKELKTSVVIEFLVNSDGIASPRLAGSSGNDELDAIAIHTAAKWQFRPAEENHKPIQSKIRLRIIFEVQ